MIPHASTTLLFPTEEASQGIADHLTHLVLGLRDGGRVREVLPHVLVLVGGLGLPLDDCGAPGAGAECLSRCGLGRGWV